MTWSPMLPKPDPRPKKARRGIRRKTPLRSETPLERGGPIERRTRVNPINRERKAKLYARNFGEKADWIRSLPCLVSGCSRSPVDPAHVRARGMGGAKGDKAVLVPLCRGHHDEAGEYRTSKRAAFEEHHLLDLVAEAAEFDHEWQCIQEAA